MARFTLQYRGAMGIDIPTQSDIVGLTQHRHEASVTIYLSAAELGARAVVHDPDAAKLALRSAFSDALAELGGTRQDRQALTDAVQELVEDRDFWGTGARSLAIFVSPEGLRAFRLMNELAGATSTGDRFDVGPMIRAITFAHVGYVLALTEGEVRLLHLDATASRTPVALTELPEDAADALTREPATGRFNRHRADGALAQKPEQKRYAVIVEGAVRAAIGSSDEPLILAATSEFEHAYRDANTYGRLLDQAIGANPTSLSDEDLEQRARAILDEHYAARITDWVETFGNRRAHGKGSTQLAEVARAATEGRVSELLFDIDAAQEGTIDETGEMTLAEEAGPRTYRVVDEIATRVLRTGGRVRAVRTDDMPDGAPVAALHRS